MTVRITWLGHAGIKITGASAIVYIDPWKIGKSPGSADIVLLTHDHYDHYSEEDVKIISNAETHVVAPMSAPVVTDLITPGASLSIKGVSIQAMPAYNLEKAFHPKAKGWVGYIVTIDGKTIYHSGDTDRIPEMKGIAVDVMLIPVGGTFTMDAQEASEALKDMKATYAIPIHYGEVAGSRKDAEKLAKLSSCDVRVLNPREYIEIE